VEKFFRIPASRLTVIPNGLDHSQFRPGSKPAAREAVCTPAGIAGPFFLYVARLEHPAKNHCGLINAFNRFKATTGSAWRLVLAGGDWHGSQTIRALVHASPFVHDISLLGFVPSEQLADWYRAADVFVFPSLYEGFGMPPVEAMACGCPVLSSVTGALVETVGDAAGQLDPHDIPQMQAQLGRAATDEAWRTELGVAGTARARAFDWNATAQAVIDVYSRALAPWGQSRGEDRVSTHTSEADPGARLIPAGSPGTTPSKYDQTR